MKIFNILRPLRHILIGWLKRYKLLPSTDAEKKLSDLRVDKCRQCEFSKMTPILELLDTGGEYVDTLYCTKCTCPCRQKSLILTEKCPINLW